MQGREPAFSAAADLEQRRLHQDLWSDRIGLPGWKMTADFFELSDFRGSFRYTTALGAVTGLELHLGVIDDVVKGRQETFSKTVRDRTWLWFTDDFRTRFNKDAGLLAIGTRWHVDDLLGRLIEKYPESKVLRYPAIAEVDEEVRRSTVMHLPSRKAGLTHGRQPSGKNPNHGSDKEQGYGAKLIR
jgi:hypothetical protein